MSKAFTRESDDASEDPIALPQRTPLPPGARNYITPAGVRRLRDELDQLTRVDRPPLAASPESADAKRRLRMIDHRARMIGEALQSAVVVEPPPDRTTVRFGATVGVRNQRGEQIRYRIVGVDETDLDRNWVSWLTPIAKALLNARLGQKVRFRFPDGQERLEIQSISYE